MSRPQPESSSAYQGFYDIQIRWSDIDMNGHVNNVVYLQYFETAVVHTLMAAGAFDLKDKTPTAVAAHNEVDYFSEIPYPSKVTVGMRIKHIGTTSLHWDFGIFGDNEEMTAAKGSCVHVYIDRQTRNPVPLTPELKALAERFLME